ncbi:ECF-type sigma factor [Elongatibacter sediminis]|uniref:ECF-type sigma factor n=1 Tax=Elongatibacter sediminis TaxID=3119006 RepID=A0AAW9R6Y2_9GAMM
MAEDDMSSQSGRGRDDSPAEDNAAHLDDLIGKIYHDLRQIAHLHRRGAYGNLTLQTTALVHEAYLRMAGTDSELSLQDRQHLKALTSRIIRHIIVDYARRAGAAKRDAANAPHERIEDSLIEPMLDVGVLDLDVALHRLSGRSPRLEKIVECRFFGGMNVQETADALGLSPRTVERDWRKAKAYLLRFLQEDKSKMNA